MRRIADKQGHSRPGRAAAVVLLTLAALLVPAAPVAADAPGSFSLGFATSRLWDANWGRGFEADLLLPMTKRGGLRLGGGLIMESGAFDGLGGAMLDVGFWRSYGSGRLRSVALAGLSLSVGDPQDTDLNAIGAHIGFREELWLGRRFGVYGRAILRLWLPEGGLDAFAPSFGVGLCLRL